MVCSCGYFSKKKCKEIFESVLLKEFSDFREIAELWLKIISYRKIKLISSGPTPSILQTNGPDRGGKG
jgi:hypothetical protein